MKKQNLSPQSWRQQREMTMAGMAIMLGISGKNPGRTWHRYESGAAEPPLSLVARVEMISEGQVTTTSWLHARHLHLARSPIGVAQ